MQCVTKEFCAKGVMVSQVIPFLDILEKEPDWNHLSNPDTTNKFRDTLTTKDKMLSSLYSRFEQIYSNNIYLLATLLDRKFKVNFLTQ